MVLFSIWKHAETLKPLYEEYVIIAVKANVLGE